MNKPNRPVIGLSLSLLVYLFLFSVCSQGERVGGCVDYAEGDLVFRRGVGMKSEAVLRADTSGLYTHAGIVVKYGSAFMIIHITPGERAVGELEDRIKMESPEVFFGSDRATFGAVYRLRSDSSGIAEAAANEAIRLYDKGIVFDHDYLLEDSTAMYCTELVWRVYLLSGMDITDGKRSTVSNVPLFSGLYILPADIYNNKELFLVFKF